MKCDKNKIVEATERELLVFWLQNETLYELYPWKEYLSMMKKCGVNVIVEE